MAFFLAYSCTFPFGRALPFVACHATRREPDVSLGDWKTVGIPKGACLDSRPISVASVLVRALWAGRRGVSVLHAIAAFSATPKTGVAELDLSKAFDTINHFVADTAMQAHGLRRHLRHVLLRAWKAPGASPFLALDSSARSAAQTHRYMQRWARWSAKLGLLEIFDKTAILTSDTHSDQRRGLGFSDKASHRCLLRFGCYLHFVHAPQLTTLC